MESPDSWNLLTASLAVSDLRRPHEVWCFLTSQGLVRDGPGDLEGFLQFVGDETERGEITGPSLARRIASSVENSGMALKKGFDSDPWAKTAKKRRDQFVQLTRGPIRPRRSRFSKLCSAVTSVVSRLWHDRTLEPRTADVQPDSTVDSTTSRNPQVPARGARTYAVADEQPFHLVVEFCPHCGKKLSVRSLRCPDCSSVFSHEPEWARVPCETCGRWIPARWRFCGYCRTGPRLDPGISL